MIKLDLSKCATFKHHRHGWKYCISSLKNLHSKSGIFCDGYIEHTYVSDIRGKNTESILPYKKNWIGFMHNPPNGPTWLDKSNCCDYIIETEQFQESLNSCKCIITLSRYLRNWLEKKINIPIIDIKYATDIRVKQWNSRTFLKHRHIPLLQIGYWLRNIQFIRDINCPSRYVKIWLPSSYEYAKDLIHRFSKINADKKRDTEKWRQVSIPKYIDNASYDEIMSRSVVCIDLYDASANTTIIDCIARNTPIIVNKLPAIIEYLGADYPLYFEDKKDVPHMLNDIDLLISAHEYLKKIDKHEFTGSFFAIDLHRKLSKTL